MGEWDATTIRPEGNETQRRIVLGGGRFDREHASRRRGNDRGLRRSNLLELAWSEVDLERALNRIPASKAKGKHDITLPIPPDLLEVLRRLRCKNDSKPRPSTRAFEGLRSFERAFRSACKFAGLLEVTFRDLPSALSRNLDPLLYA